MKFKGILVLLAALILVPTFVSCGGEKELTAEEIKDAVIKAWDDIETVRTDTDLSADMSVSVHSPDEDYDISYSMTGNMTSLTNVANQNMYSLSQMQMNFDMPPEMQDPEDIYTNMDMTTEYYFMDKTLYVKSDTSEEPGTWTKQEFSEEYWENMNQIGQGVELLKPATVELLGSEQLEGVDCYVLKVTPDLAAMYEKLFQSIGQGGQWLSKIFDFEEIVQSTSMKMVIAKDTFYVMQVEMQMTIVMNQENMHLPLGEATFEVSGTSEYVSRAYDYNQPVSITLPAEAEGGVEVPISG